MTIASRRLARRCRERFAKDRGLLPAPAAPPATPVRAAESATDAQPEKVDAAK